MSSNPSNPYKPFSDLYVIPGLAGSHMPRAPAWHTPFLDPCTPPEGYDSLRGVDDTVPVTAPVVATPGAVAAAPEPASALPVILGGFAVGYLLGRFIKW